MGMGRFGDNRKRENRYGGTITPGCGRTLFTKEGEVIGQSGVLNLP
jgi:hypothetical protein